eukprot:gene3406-biopygen23227
MSCDTHPGVSLAVWLSEGGDQNNRMEWDKSNDIARIWRIGLKGTRRDHVLPLNIVFKDIKSSSNIHSSPVHISRNPCGAVGLRPLSTELSAFCECFLRRAADDEDLRGDHDGLDPPLAAPARPPRGEIGHREYRSEYRRADRSFGKLLLVQQRHLKKDSGRAPPGQKKFAGQK